MKTEVHLLPEAPPDHLRPQGFSIAIPSSQLCNTDRSTPTPIG
jgi:hypothetical protein